MFRRIFRIILMFTIIIISVSKSTYPPVNITCTFDIEDGMYTVVLANQNYIYDQKPRIFGKHFGGNVNINVRKLSASYKNNNMTSVPPTLLRIFPNLKVIFLEDCGLKQISDESFKYAKNVKHIKFGKDTIKIAPNTFSKCQKLKTLEFDGNDLSSIDPDSFKDLGNLKTLVLNNVKIQSVFIYAQIFKHLKKLEKIQITNNYLKLFPIVALEHMPFLKIINVSHNAIDMITNEFIKDKPYLEMLDLSYNKIEVIESTLISNWRNHATLNLTSNICISENFENIGSDDNPTIQVANALEKCFNDRKIPGTIQIQTEKLKDDEKDEFNNEEKELTDTTKFSKPINDSKIIKHLVESERETSDSLKNTSDKENGGLIGSPYEFIKNDKNDSKVAAVQTTTVSHKDSNESDSDEEEEATTATTLATTTITNTESTITSVAAEIKKKKRKKKGKSKGLVESEVIAATTIADVPVESPEDNKNSKSTSAEVLQKNKESEIPKKDEVAESTEVEKKGDVFASENQSNLQKPIDNDNAENQGNSFIQNESQKPSEGFLHNYEQATGRVYHDADGNYHCVIENATSEVKKFNIDHIGNYTNENITHVFFVNSRFYHVPRNLVKTFPNLVHLSIKRTKIFAMTHDFFEDCGKVKSIDMRENNIRYVEFDALKHCKNLEFLDQSENPLETIESEIFENNPNLTIIFGKLKIKPSNKNKNVRIKEHNKTKNNGKVSKTPNKIIDDAQIDVSKIILPQNVIKNVEEKKESVPSENVGNFSEKSTNLANNKKSVEEAQENTENKNVNEKDEPSVQKIKENNSKSKQENVKEESSQVVDKNKIQGDDLKDKSENLNTTREVEKITGLKEVKKKEKSSEIERPEDVNQTSKMAEEKFVKDTKAQIVTKMESSSESDEEEDDDDEAHEEKKLEVNHSKPSKGNETNKANKVDKVSKDKMDVVGKFKKWFNSR